MGCCNSFALIQCFFLYNGTCVFSFSITNQCVTDCSDSWNHFLFIVSHSLAAPHPHCLLFPRECCDQDGLCVPGHERTVRMALCCRASLWHCGTASWVLEGQRFQEFTLQIVFEQYQHYLEEACIRCWAVQLLLPLCILVPSRARSPGACQGQGSGQELGMQTPGVVFCWGRTHQLCGPCAQNSRLDHI